MNRLKYFIPCFFSLPVTRPGSTESIKSIKKPLPEISTVMGDLLGRSKKSDKMENPANGDPQPDGLNSSDQREVELSGDLSESGVPDGAPPSGGRESADYATSEDNNTIPLEHTSGDPFSGDGHQSDGNNGNLGGATKGIADSARALPGEGAVGESNNRVGQEGSHLSHVLMGNLDNLPPVQSTSVRILLSSTFSGKPNFCIIAYPFLSVSCTHGRILGGYRLTYMDTLSSGFHISGGYPLIKMFKIKLEVK